MDHTISMNIRVFFLRQKLLLLLTFLVGLCLPASADDDPTLNDSSYYEISTAAQLKWFADKVNSGDNTINGVLTADIDVSMLGDAYWTPIGLWDESGTNVYYKGKFNGQNHTIKGIVLRKALASGLFGATESAVISNVTVKGAQMKATRDDVVASVQYGIGSVCGIATSGTVIENCHSTMTDIIYAINQYNKCKDIDCVGGVVGELRESTAKDCSANGFVRTDGNSVGGIVGFLNSGLVQNCQFKNYDNGSSAVVGIDKVGGIAGSLQGRSRANAIVDCSVADSVILNATAGVCDTICAMDTLLTEPGVFNSSYEIYTPNQLKWLSETVNAGNTNFNAKLMNDINMSNAGDFTPIGTSDHPWSEVFDGQEYTIDSLTISGNEYAGLFGYVKDGGIKNINLDHALLNTAGKNYQGLLVGFLTQDPNDKDKKGYIENCNVTNGNLARAGTSTSSYVGGIVGKVDMSAEVRNCSFQGEVKGHEDYIGGIAGCMDSGAKMYRCTTIGASTMWGNNYVGGVVGYMTDTQTMIDNCDVDQSTGAITIHAEDGNNSGLVRGYDKSGGVTNTKYNEGGLQYEVTGKKVTVDGKSVTETHITGVSTANKGTYYACVDIGSSGSDYFNTVIESVNGAEELYFWDNVSNLAGTKACGWINMTINDYAFGSNFKALKMYYHMFAGDDHDVMLRPSDVRPVGENMFGNCPNAKVYVDAEYYEEFCNDSAWSKYKKYLVPVTSMRTEDVNAEYGARYAYDRNRDKTGSLVKNGNVHQVHVIGADDSYLNDSDNENTLWIYQDIGQTYDYNTTKVWASSFKGKDNIKQVKFQEITKSGRRASQAFKIEIGDSAFANCANLTAFNIALYSDEGNDHVEYLRPENLPIGKNVFAGSNNVKIYVPRVLVDAFKNDTEYGWSQYKALICEGDFGATDYTECGVVYSYYTSADGQTRYRSNNNTEMEAILSPLKSSLRNFSPSQVLVYNQSDKVKYMLASGVNADKINSEKGVMKLYSDIGETYPNHYKTVALSASGFQNQTCIKEIKFEDIVSNNYNTITDFSLIIPDGTFKGCSNLKTLNMFMLNTKGTNHYEAIKPSQVFIGEHVFDDVDENFSIRVHPALYNDYITDPNWSQYKDLIVASDYLPTDATEVTCNGVTYDYATKVMNGMTSKQVTSLKTSWWTALVIGVEVALTAATWGSGSAASAASTTSANLYVGGVRASYEGVSSFTLYWTKYLAQPITTATKELAKLGYRAIGNRFITNRAYWLSAILSMAAVSMDAAALVGTKVVGTIHDNNTAFNYISNRIRKNFNRPSTWSMTGGGYVINTEQIDNVPHMYVKKVEDRDVAIIYNDCGDGNDDYQTVAVAYDAFHNKKLLEEVKFQERFGDGSRSIAGGLTIALPDSMFSGCTKLKTLNLVNWSSGAESANHCYKALTPDNFIPMGDIFAGMDSMVLAGVKIKVGKEVMQEFLDDEYWSRYKDMFEGVDVRIVRKQLEWSCNYALAYDKNTLPLRTTSGTHNIDHVYVYAPDDDELKSNEGLAALINDFGNWNNYKLDYVKNDAFKGNSLLTTLDMTDSHTNVADVYDNSFYIAIQDSAFAHCPNFENLNLIYQVTDGTNHCEQMKPEQFTLGNGVFDDTPKLKIKFCLDQEDAFLADTAWVKYKDKFAPCFFEPVDEKVGDILLHPYRFMTKLNNGTNFSYVDATRPKPEALKTLFKASAIGTFDEFRAFGSCGLRTIYNGMFADCSSLQHIMLPDSTQTIETNAFQNCSLLRQLTIPEKVTSIQENAFTGSGISEFTVKSAVPADIDAAKAFAGLTNADSYIIYVTDSVVDTYKTKWAAVADHINGIGKRQGLKVVHLKEAGTLAKELGLEYTYTSNIFKDNKLTGNYAQYDSLRIIGPMDGRDIGVIRYMGGRDVDENKPTAGHLKYLDLYEADLKSAGSYDYNRAFFNNSAEFGNIGAWANNSIRNDNEVSYFMFWGLNSLETLILPKSATSIKYGAFEHCKNLKMLVIGDNMTDIAKEVRESYVAVSTPNKTVLVMLGDKVPETDEKSFFPTSGTSFGWSDLGLKYPVTDDSRFKLCITPYNSVKYYASDYAYTSTCDSLIANFEDQALVEALKKKHVFSQIDLMGITDIMGYVNGNKEIKKFDDLYMSSVTMLGDSTLTGMENLETVSIPIACKKITATAFKGCNSLMTVNAFCEEPPALEENAFDSLPEDFVIYVPEGLEDTYRKAWEQYKTHINGYRSIRDDVREITLTEPNTLADSLDAKFTMVGNKIKSVGGNLGTLTHLKVSGPIGGKDLALIRYLGGREPDWNNHVYVTNLKYLDLYDAELRADSYEFMLKGVNRHIENDNEIPKDMLWNCDNLETVILPRTATKLSYEACYDMASLKTLVIGDDVTYIDDDALGDNRKLEQIIFLCKSKPGIDGDAFTDPLEGDNRKVGKMYVRKNLLEDFSEDLEYAGHTGELIYGFEDGELFSAFGCKAIPTEDDLASVSNVDGWFKRYPEIKNMSQLSKTKITSLNSGDLDNLKGLMYVSLPSTLTTLGKDVFKENTALHWVDLTACDSLKTDISTLGVCGDALVYQPASFAESNVTNVVYGKSGSMQCKEFYFTDSHGYDVPKAFTAKKVTFGRKFTPNTYTTITLPFSLTDKPSGFKFYTIDADSVKNGVMYFKPVTDGVTATSPYVVKAKKEQMVIDAETAVPTTPYRTNTVKGNGYILTGNLQAVTAANAKALKYMTMNDTTRLWNLATTDNDSIRPYSVYAQTLSTDAATSDVESKFTDVFYHYYIGTTKYDLEGDGTEDEPLYTDKLELVDGLDFKADKPFRADAASYSREMTSTWGTLCLPYAFDATGNETCEFYELTSNDGSTLTLTKIKSGTIDAGCPVMVRRRYSDKPITIAPAEAVDVCNEAGNSTMLVGSFAQIDVPDGTYIISKDKFWLVDRTQSGGVGAKIKSFRGYITTSSDAKAAVLGITVDDEATCIDSLNSVDGEATTEYYDAVGRRTNGLQPGLNIIKNGNRTVKVMVK